MKLSRIQATFAPWFTPAIFNPKLFLEARSILVTIAFGMTITSWGITNEKIFALFSIVLMSGIVIFAIERQELYRLKEETMAINPGPQLKRTISQQSETIFALKSQLCELQTQPAKEHGVVYVFRRADSVIKIGHTNNLRRRLREHCVSYDAEFAVCAAWVVDNPKRYERLALHATEGYAHYEDNRNELRKMSDQELGEFILNFIEEIYSDKKKV